MRVTKGAGNFYVLKVPRASRAEIAGLMAYRGLTFSTSASSKEQAVLFSDNPYALADLANGECPELAPYRAAIDASRALTGVGTLRLPPGRELKEYQKATLDYLLARGGGINGDAPGLGKTPTSIAFCNAVEAQRILVICPAGPVRTQWQDRIKEWSTIPNVKISVMTKVKDGIHPFAHYQIISYESARNPNIIRAISKYQWDVLICDEAHRCANVQALTSRAVLGNSRGEYQHGEDKMPSIGTYAKHRLALTGTLLRNRPSEAFNLLRYFDHESIDFMNEDAFRERYNKQADLKTLTGKRFKLESTSLEFELQNRLRVNVMARHVKLEIPGYDAPPRYSLIRVEEDGAVKAALNAEGLLDLDIEEVSSGKISIEEQGHIAEVRRIMGTAIAPQIADYAKEFLEGSEEKLVVFTWHYAVTDILVERLAKFGVVWLDGRKSATKKKLAVDEFRQNAKVRAFVGNIQAAGTGTDGLQEVCSHCFIAEPDWVPSNMEQPVSRLDRIGQENIVNADIFVAPGSISEKILVRALEKLNIINRVMDERKT